MTFLCHKTNVYEISGSALCIDDVCLTFVKKVDVIRLTSFVAENHVNLQLKV